MIIHLPIRLSKKAGAVLVVLMFALIGAALFVFLKNNKETEHTAQKKAEYEEGLSLAILDSDGDGLKDWEEAIYATDPKSPDTDGDGTKDGDEISENRGPLLSGHEDALSLKNHKNTASHELLKKLAKEGNLTTTLIQNIIQQKGINSFLNPALAKKTSAEILAYIKELRGGRGTFENKISEEELVIKEESDKESIQAYFNATTRVYEKYIFPLKEDDIEIVLEALQTQKQDPLLRLDILLDAITKTVEEIKKIPVPRSILDLHKKELDFGEQTIRDIEVLKNVQIDDTLLVSVLLNVRLELKKEVGNFHRKEVPDWLKAQKITFAADADARKLYPL